MQELEGKVAIVTGAGRGIARGIVRRLAAEGMHVAVVSRTATSVDDVVAEIEAAGGRAIGITCDVGHEDQIQSAIARTVETLGRLDVLVNSAQGFGTEAHPRGASVPTGIEDYCNEEWEYTFRTGATATLWAMKAVFPHLKDRGGRIINFGSYQGVQGAAGFAAYNATKEAIRALTRTAAREWGRHNILVNCINPMVRSHSFEVFEKEMPEVAAEALKNVPLGRWGDPFDDAGGLAVFLASSNSAYLTGMTFPLNGGLTIGASDSV